MSDPVVDAMPESLDDARVVEAFLDRCAKLGAVLVTEEELAKALRDVEREWTNGAHGTPLYRDEPGIIAASIFAAIKEATDG